LAERLLFWRSADLDLFFVAFKLDLMGLKKVCLIEQRTDSFRFGKDDQTWAQFGRRVSISDKPGFATKCFFAATTWRGFLTTASATAINGDSSGVL
jgi:hypothetical protein